MVSDLFLFCNVCIMLQLLVWHLVWLGPPDLFLKMVVLLKKERSNVLGESSSVAVDNDVG